MKDKTEIIAQAELPVDEILRIRRHRIQNGNGKRICVVTGIHGDELEGQYVCWKLSRVLHSDPDAFSGTVDIYPAMNPFGIDSITRGIPAFDLDMNRIFPGNYNGDMNEYLAAEALGSMEGADLALDIHASNIYLTEMPQIRINELHKDWLVPIAEKANMDLIWVHGASTVLESTLAFSLNSRKIPALVVEMGVGMRITKKYGDQLVTGILSLMNSLGMWKKAVPDVRKPVTAYDEKGETVCYLNAPVSGIYIKERDHGALVKKDELVGRIVDPLSGETVADIKAPSDGWLFTTREYPVVDEGSLMGRILRKEFCTQLYDE